MLDWKNLPGISTATHNKFDVIMGKIGTRKTTSAGTYPKPMLYITIGSDGGEEVLKKYGDDEIKLLNLNSDVIAPNTKPRHVYDKLMEVLNDLKQPHPFKTVVIDPYTGVEEGLVKFFTQLKGKQLNEQEWGKVGEMMRDMRDVIAELSKGEVQYVAVCHIKENKLGDSATGTQTVEYVPKMTIKNGQTFLEKASNVMYACRKTVLSDGGIPEVKFLMYIGAHPYMDTKIRLPNADKLEKGLYIENFTYEKLQEIIKNQDFENKVNVVENDNPFSDDKEEKDNKENW